MGGVIATGTHGTGARFANLGTGVVSMRIVDGLGQVRVFDESTPGDLLNAARLHLGALGVVTQVSLRCVKHHLVREEQIPMPLSSALADLERLVDSSDHTKLWIEPHGRQAVVFLMTKTQDPEQPRPWWRMIESIKIRALDALNKLVLNRFPSVIPPIMKFVGPGMFSHSVRIEDPRLVLNIHHPIPIHSELELAVPFPGAAESLARLVDEIERDGVAVGSIIEVRFVRADGQWMSPTYREDHASLQGRASDGFVYITALIEGSQDRIQRQVKSHQ